MLTLSELFQQGQRWVANNSTSVLTGIGVTGTVTTAVLTGRASFKAAEIIEDERAKRLAEENFKSNQPDEKLRTYLKIDTMDKVKLVWPHYIAPVGVGGLTIAAIVMANRVSSKQAAALAAAYGLSEKAFAEYKDKVAEKITAAKVTQINDEIAQDKVNAHPINTREVILAGTGEVLCFDMLTGRYFQSSVEEIKQAVNRVNFDIIQHMYASLSSMYDQLELPPTAFSDSVGWNANHLIEAQLSTTMSTDGRPCITVSFEPPPVPEYANLY